MTEAAQRVQTGIRIEKRTLKVLRALADYLDMSLGDLIEGVVWHAFEGKTPFADDTLAQIAKLKSIYGLTLSAKDSHRLREETAGGGAAKRPRAGGRRAAR